MDIDFNGLLDGAAPAKPVSKERRQSVLKTVTGSDADPDRVFDWNSTINEPEAEVRPAQKQKTKPRKLTGDKYKDVFQPAFKLAGEYLQTVNNGWTVSDWNVLAQRWVFLIEQLEPGSLERKFVDDLELLVIDYLGKKTGRKPPEEFETPDGIQTQMMETEESS